VHGHPEHTPVIVLDGGPEIVVTAGLSLGGDAASKNSNDVCAQRVREQEAFGGTEEALGRLVERGSHDQLCRLQAQGEEDFPPRRSVVRWALENAKGGDSAEIAMRPEQSVWLTHASGQQAPPKVQSDGILFSERGRMAP
jgi:hypothetical protein